MSHRDVDDAMQSVKMNLLNASPKQDRRCTDSELITFMVVYPSIFDCVITRGNLLLDVHAEDVMLHVSSHVGMI